MQIKTIWEKLKNSKKFDDRVNEALEEGWSMLRREVLPTQDLTGLGDCNPSTLYAELVKLDPPTVPEPLEIDPLEAVQIVKDACINAESCGPACPLHAWCIKSLPSQPAPDSWILPEVATL